MNLAVPRQASLGGTTATGQDANSMRPRLVEPTSMPAWGRARRWPTTRSHASCARLSKARVYREQASMLAPAGHRGGKSQRLGPGRHLRRGASTSKSGGMARERRLGN
ncbi:MAG: hypothetical protein QOG96_2101 [Pseudonocardiales bacterium]|nr:hypothetical protein [Pseudonocardiales bacterium]